MRQKPPSRGGAKLSANRDDQERRGWCKFWHCTRPAVDDSERCIVHCHTEPQPVVYFVLAPSANVLKIGTTFLLAKRMKNIVASSPVTVSLLGVIAGGEQVERWCHHHLFAERSHYEWFRWTPSTQMFVETLLAAGDDAAKRFCAEELRLDYLMAVGRVLRSPWPPLTKTISPIVAEQLARCECPFCEGCP